MSTGDPQGGSVSGVDLQPWVGREIKIFFSGPNPSFFQKGFLKSIEPGVGLIQEVPEGAGVLQVFVPWGSIQRIVLLG